VKVIDDYALQVTLEKPVTYFLEKLSYPVSFVVDEKNVPLR
jgi:ABC-type oligopeptide transport system substrate-binding subunit